MLSSMPKEPKPDDVAVHEETDSPTHAARTLRVPARGCCRHRVGHQPSSSLGPTKRGKGMKIMAIVDRHADITSGKADRLLSLNLWSLSALTSVSGPAAFTARSHTARVNAASACGFPWTDRLRLRIVCQSFRPASIICSRFLPRSPATSVSATWRCRSSICPRRAYSSSGLRAATARAWVCAGSVDKDKHPRGPPSWLLVRRATPNYRGHKQDSTGSLLRGRRRDQKKATRFTIRAPCAASTWRAEPHREHVIERGKVCASAIPTCPQGQAIRNIMLLISVGGGESAIGERRSRKRCYGASGEDNGTIVAPANQRSAPCHS